MIQSRLIGAVFLLAFLAYGYTAKEIPLDFWAEVELFNARSFPIIVSVGGSIFALIFIFQAPSSPAEPLSGLNIELVGLIGLMLLYAAFLERLGFISATVIFLVSAFLILGERRPIILFAVSGGITTCFYFLMSVLEIYLPQGAWIEL